MIEWDDLVYATAERFGGTMPHPDTAHTIAAIHAKAPHAVERAIDRVADDYNQGNIRSPWGILKARVQQITIETTQAKHGNERETDIARAEQWIRTIGRHLTWTDVEDELFAPPRHTPTAEWLIQLEQDTRNQPGRPTYEPLLKAAIVRTLDEGPQPTATGKGTLKQHDTPELRDRLHDLWQTLEP